MDSTRINIEETSIPSAFTQDWQVPSSLGRYLLSIDGSKDAFRKFVQDFVLYLVDRESSAIVAFEPFDQYTSFKKWKDIDNQRQKKIVDETRGVIEFPPFSAMGCNPVFSHKNDSVSSTLIKVADVAKVLKTFECSYSFLTSWGGHFPRALIFGCWDCEDVEQVFVEHAEEFEFCLSVSVGHLAVEFLTCSAEMKEKLEEFQNTGKNK